MDGRVTEKTCSKCGETNPPENFYKDSAKKDGLRRECKECTRTKNQRYYRENSDTIKSHVRSYRLDNLREVKEKKRVYSRKYREENRVLLRKKGREYRIRNLERERCRAREYGRSNPEANRAKKARYRQRLAVGVNEVDRLLSVEYRKAIANDPCFYCGCHLEEMHDDHMTPLARGGTDHWWNLVRACAPCNLSKSDKTVEEFFEYLGR